MQVTHAAPEDSSAVADIHIRTWRAAFQHTLPDEFLANLSLARSEAMWSRCIAEGTPELLVAKVGEDMKGWLSFGASRDADAPSTNAEVWAFYVAPEAWSTGAGRLLWLESKRLMQKRKFETCSLWVFPQNHRAIRFYELAGFVLDDVVPKTMEFAGKPVAQVRYTCTLNH